MDMSDEYGKCFECGWISALKYMKDKVEEKWEN
jgi:hypothetical protein